VSSHGLAWASWHLEFLGQSSFAVSVLRSGFDISYGTERIAADRRITTKGDGKDSGCGVAESGEVRVQRNSALPIAARHSAPLKTRLLNARGSAVERNQ